MSDPISLLPSPPPSLSPHRGANNRMRGGLEATIAQEPKIPNLKNVNHEKLVKAAQEFESIYMDMVMKSMRETVDDTAIFGDSEKVRFFQTMLDTEYAKRAGQGQKLGLAEAIVKQVTQLSSQPPNGNERP